ncbi:hypothetical protein GNP10_14615 [Escherichia coli]|nr:hypothetical protein [Escherichia coli]
MTCTSARDSATLRWWMGIAATMRQCWTRGLLLRGEERRQDMAFRGTGNDV